MHQLNRPDYPADSVGNGIGTVTSKWIMDGAKSDSTFTFFTRRFDASELHYAMVIHDDFAVFHGGYRQSWQ